MATWFNGISVSYAWTIIGSTKLEEARTRQGTLVARHQAAEARKRLAQSVSGLGEDAFSSFERFEQKVEAKEAEASAHVEIA